MLLRLLLLVLVAVTIEIACEKSTLARALVSVIEISYLQKARVFNFYIKCEEDVQRIRYFKDLADTAIHQMDNISVRTAVQQQLSVDDERHYCVLAVDSVDAIRLLYHEVRQKHFYIGGYVLIVLHTFKNHYYDVVMDILEENWRTGIINVNIIVEPIPGMVLMFTYYPYSVYSCKIIIPVISNRFVKSQWEIDELFPSKLKNMHGCPVVCATWEKDPYLKINRDEYGNESHLTGIEGRLLDFISWRLNFSINFYIMNDEEIDATLDEKGAVFDKLFKSGVEFAIGSFNFKVINRDSFILPSSSYYLSVICIVMSSRRERIPSFAKLLLPFRKHVWKYLFIYFGIGILIVLGTGRFYRKNREFIIGSSNNAPIYNMLTTAVGSGVHKIPKRSFARFLLCIWLLKWLVLRSVYQSALFHFIRTDISLPLPDSIEDVIKHEYEILLTPAVYESTKNIPSIRGASKFLNGSEVDNFPMLTRIVKKVAILTPYEYFGFFKKHNKNQVEQLHLAKGIVLTQPLSAYLRKNSFLLDEFNGRILETQSIGLMQNWNRNIILWRMKHNEARMQQSLKTMSLLDVLGVFDLLVLGHCCSLAVFGVEICIPKLQKLYKRYFQ